MITFKYTVLAAGAFVIFQTCSPTSAPDNEPIFCTGEFATISVAVEDLSGEPVEEVDITIIHKASGDVLPCDDLLCQHKAPGEYIIMHDGFKDVLSPSGDTFVVEGSKGGLNFRQEFTIRGGVCHVDKISGPDTVQLTES